MVTAVSIYLAGFAATFMPGIYGGSTAKTLTYIALGAILIAAILLKVFGDRRRKLDFPHGVRLVVLKAVAEEWQSRRASNEEKLAATEASGSATAEKRASAKP